MFRFFNKYAKHQKSISFEPIEVDIHAHWLPGVDDGSGSIQESLRMIEGLVALGFRKLIATPHIMHDYYGNDAKKLGQIFIQTEEAVIHAKIDVELELAAEYMLDEGFMKHFETHQILSIQDKYVLVEFPMNKPFPLAAKFVEYILHNGYTPILAHPERYAYYRKDVSMFKELQQMGCMMQLNLLSPTGHYGKEVAYWSRQLLDSRIYHFVGSDLHRPAQLGQYDFDPNGYQFLNSQLFQPVGS